MDAREGWIGTLGDLKAKRQSCVVVVVTGVEGSAPREVGARMIVTDGDLHWGTIGGGNLERLAIEHARDLQANPAASSETVAYALGEEAGQCCGGRVQLFFEPLRWRRHRLTIFGAGHVGQALAGLAPWIGADVELVDEREAADIRPALDSESERPFRLTCVDSVAAEVDRLAADSFVVVMTHSHALDLEIIERALRRGDLAYVGLIGSDRKWSRFRARLQAKGFGESEIGAVRCPIGVSRASKEPTAIALSAATELVESMSRSPAATPSPRP